MEVFLDWLRANPDVFGFSVATLIFFITIILVSSKLINFAVTILLLIFSLVAGFMITNQDNFADLFKSTPPVEQSE